MLQIGLPSRHPQQVANQQVSAIAGVRTRWAALPGSRYVPSPSTWQRCSLLSRAAATMRAPGPNYRTSACATADLRCAVPRPMSPTTVIAGLTDLQADGLACVVCHANYLHLRVAHLPAVCDRPRSRPGCPT